MSSQYIQEPKRRFPLQGSRRPARAIAALLLVALPFVGPAVGGDERPGGGGFSDEMVGTLPSLGGWLPVRESVCDVDSDVGFYLSGPVQRVAEAVQHAVGSGYLSYELLGSDQIRIDFHGDLSLELDPTLLGGGISAGVRFGAESGSGLIALASAGRLAGPKPAHPGATVPLPLGPFRGAGVLHDGLEIQAFARVAGRRLVRLVEFEGGLFVDQSR